MNGWDADVLQAGISQCLNYVDSGAISDCPPLQASVDAYNTLNCPEQPPLVNEQVKGVLSALPGCNPPTSGPEKAASVVCPVTATLNNVTNTDNQTRYIPQPGDTLGTWTYLGCAADKGNPHPLNGASKQGQTGLTIESCQSWCKDQGFSLAGLEYGRECYCSNAMLSSLSSNATCNAAGGVMCTGNSLETCGGGDIMHIWNNTAYSGPAIKAAPTAGVTTLSVSGGVAQYQGCYLENSVSSRALSGAVYMNSTGMSLETCAAYCQTKGFSMFGTEYSSGMSLVVLPLLFNLLTIVPRMLLRQLNLHIYSSSERLQHVLQR